MLNKNRLAAIALILAISILVFKIHADSEPNLKEACQKFSDLGWTQTENGGVRYGNSAAFMAYALFFADPEGNWSFNVITTKNSCVEEDNYLIFNDKRILTTNVCEDLDNGYQINSIAPKTKKGKEFLFSEIYTNPGEHNVKLHTHHHADIDSTNLKCALYRARKRSEAPI
jgi:hypothetical protein